MRSIKVTHQRQMAEYGLRVKSTIKETTMNSKEAHKQVQQIRMTFQKEIAASSYPTPMTTTR